MIDDLLQSISKLSEDVTDLQASNRHLYDLITSTEMEVDCVHFRLSRLRQNICKLDHKFDTVVKLWKNKETSLIAKRVI